MDISTGTIKLLIALLMWLIICYYWFEEKKTSPNIRPIKHLRKPLHGTARETTDIPPTRVTDVVDSRNRQTEVIAKEVSRRRYNSGIYKIIYTKLGVIMFEKHLVNETSKVSTTCTASGDGLRHGRVGEPSSIMVKIDKAASRKYGRSLFVSVLLVSDHHIQPVEAEIEEHIDGNIVIHYSIVPTLPGKYDLFVEEMSEEHQKQISGSPFGLTVTGDELNIVDVRRRHDDLPSCQTLSPRDPSWLDGAWMTRRLAGTRRGTLRSGWVYQPDRCSFDIFSKDELNLASIGLSTVPRKIAILGTSTERGIFLSMIDLLLSTEEKKFLSESDLGKCWGFAQFRLANLTLVYQDFRVFKFIKATESYKEENGTREITCHNEKLADEGVQLVHNATGFLRETLFNKTAEWPDVVLVVVNDAVQLGLLLKDVPQAWNGTIYPVNNFRSKFGRFYTAEGRQKNLEEIAKFQTLDRRVQIFDGFALGSGMRHATESSPLIMKANHFHKWCNELDGEMRLCGNPTEMVAQFFLGKTLAPLGKNKWKRQLKDENRLLMEGYVREIEICYDCPKSLLPFHIKRSPNPSCYKSREGIRKTGKGDFQVWDGTPCPQECMKTAPVEKEYTQTETVDVRRCSITVS